MTDDYDLQQHYNFCLLSSGQQTDDRSAYNEAYVSNKVFWHKWQTEKNNITCT